MSSSLPQQRLYLPNVEPGVLTILRKRKFSEHEIAAMSPQQAFREVCQWHGVMNLDANLFVAKDREEFRAICQRFEVTALDASLFNALNSLRAAVRQQPAANDRQAALSA